MKNIKGFTLGLVLGLSIAVAGIAYAQTNTQSDPNKKAECCCMAMDCCKGDSRPMMKDGEKKEGAAKSEGHKCCCGGGESCAMMKDGAMKEGAAKSEGHGRCCCGGGESCNMKDMKHMKTKDVKDSPSKP